MFLFAPLVLLNDNQEPKSLRELMDIYFKSVGREPRFYSIFHPIKMENLRMPAVARLKEFRQTLDQLYSVDYGRSFGRS